MIIFYILLHLIPLFTSWLRGIYISAQTARTDYPATSWIWLYKRKRESFDYPETARYYFNCLRQFYTDKGFREGIISGKSTGVFDLWDLWYIGGNDYYPRPDRVLTDNNNDFWHRCRTLWAALIAYNTATTFLLGLAVMASGFIYGFTNWWIVDVIITTIIAVSSAGIQEITFTRVYGHLLDYRRNQKLTWEIKLICWIVNDYKFPTYAESQNYRPLEKT